MSAEEVMIVRQNAEAVQVAPKDEVFLYVAKAIDWLLTHRVRYFDGEALRQCYMKLLSERQLLSLSGQVYLHRLAQEFIEFFSVDVLQRLGCEVDLAVNNHWLAQLVMTSAGARHPLEHILLMRFLGKDIRMEFQLT